MATKKEVTDFKLAEDRESVFEFQVPRRLSKIQFTLTAKVQNLSQNKKVDLAVREEFLLNGIDKTEEIKDLHLTNFGGQYVLELLGKNGEPRAHQAVHVTLKHRDFRRPIEVDLQTTEGGQVTARPARRCGPVHGHRAREVATHLAVAVRPTFFSRSVTGSGGCDGGSALPRHRKGATTRPTVPPGIACRPAGGGSLRGTEVIRRHAADLRSAGG